MAGGGKPLVVPESPFDGPAEGSLARSEPIVEMGVRYEAGSPSPMESILSQEPIVVDGLLAVTGGGALGFPKQFIKLKPDDPTPVACTYSGLRFVSKQAPAAGASPPPPPHNLSVRRAPPRRSRRQASCD